MDVVSGFSVPPTLPKPRDMSPADRKAHNQKLAALRQRKHRKLKKAQLQQPRAADANSVEQPAVANQQVMADQFAARGEPAEEQARLQQILQHLQQLREQQCQPPVHELQQEEGLSQASGPFGLKDAASMLAVLRAPPE
jgi:hypothetical protein